MWFDDKEGFSFTFCLSFTRAEEEGLKQLNMPVKIPILLCVLIKVDDRS